MKIKLIIIAAGMVAACLGDDAPIGVFDSGVGGLTVLEKLLSVDVVDNATGERRPDGIPDLQGEEFVQLADQANLHYGSYAEHGASAFLRELAIRDAFFLLSGGFYRDAREEVPTGRKRPAKIIVIACNTATAYGLEGIDSSLRRIASPVKVVGVVKAGVRSALRRLGAGGASAPFAIGVLSTPGTCASGVYTRTIVTEAEKLGMSSPPRVVSHGCPGLADAIQFSKPSAKDIIRKSLFGIVEELHAKGAAEPLRALILGCTHYPIAMRHFEETLEEIRRDAALGRHVAPDFMFVDPAVETAVECRETLAAEGLLANRKGESKVSMFVSVPCASLPPEFVGESGMLADGYKYSRKPGMDTVDTKFVPLAVGMVDRAAFMGLLDILPSVKEHLKRELE